MTNTVTATATNPADTITIDVDGLTIPNGTPASWNPGMNVVTIVVSNGTDSQTYTVNVDKL